jgi:hypothetical protein
MSGLMVRIASRFLDYMPLSYCAMHHKIVLTLKETYSFRKEEQHHVHGQSHHGCKAEKVSKYFNQWHNLSRKKPDLSSGK